MSSSARNARLSREIKNFMTNPPWGITCEPQKEDIFDVLNISMQGPKETPYEGGTFKLLVTIPNRYPFEPPQVKFITRVYHPNIDRGGRICINTLKMPPKGTWTPSMTLETLMVAIQTLLAIPNTEDAINAVDNGMVRIYYQSFIKTAKANTEKYAK